MDNLSCATLDPLLLAKGIDDGRGCPASLDDRQVALSRRPASREMTDRHGVKSVTGML
jgi:hypothetical protein